MGRLIFVTGGARSGKSEFVEKAIWNQKSVCYLATGVVHEKDTEWQDRIRLHKERRPSDWVTHEGYQHLASYLQMTNFQTYLLDSATMLTTNQLFKLIEEFYPEKLAILDKEFLSKDEEEHILDLLEKEWRDILDVMAIKEADIWIVTDEIGLGIVPETKLGRCFRDFQGKINQMIAKEASEAYLVIAGLAQRLK